MAVMGGQVKSELEKLTKSDLIDLLLLRTEDQRNDQLRHIKNQLDDLKIGTYDELGRKRVKTESDNKYDVGVYMAYSIFHGYLNLVIPDTGTADTHLRELMQDYESTEKMTFDFYKIFMLIPKSTYCPSNLEQLSKRIYKCNPLKEKLLTRCGVTNRSYKNAVYKIKSKEDNTFTYLVAEYATPIKTYKEVLTYNYGDDSDAYKRNKDQVIATFHSALQKILKEHEDCTDFCELIFYDDKDPSGNFRDVADVIMERIELLKSQKGSSD